MHQSSFETSVHTLSIPATGEDRNGTAQIRVLFDGLAFQARRRIDTKSVSMYRRRHIHQTDFRTVDRRRFPGDATKARRSPRKDTSTGQVKSSQQPPACFSGWVQLQGTAHGAKPSKARLTLGRRAR